MSLVFLSTAFHTIPYACGIDTYLGTRINDKSDAADAFSSVPAEQTCGVPLSRASVGFRISAARVCRSLHSWRRWLRRERMCTLKASTLSESKSPALPVGMSLSKRATLCDGASLMSTQRRRRTKFFVREVTVRVRVYDFPSPVQKGLKITFRGVFPH